MGPVFMATNPVDKAMYAVMSLVILLGVWNTAQGAVPILTDDDSYREGVSIWFRDLFAFRPARLGVSEPVDR